MGPGLWRRLLIFESAEPRGCRLSSENEWLFAPLPSSPHIHGAPATFAFDPSV